MGIDLGDIIPRRKVELAAPLEQEAGRRRLQRPVPVPRHNQGRGWRAPQGLPGTGHQPPERALLQEHQPDGAQHQARLRLRRRPSRAQVGGDTAGGEGQGGGEQALSSRPWRSGDMASARKYAEASTSLRNDMVSESKQLLDAMGIPWYDAPSEGEAQASVMAAEGTVDGVASQDHDSLLFGAPLLVRNVTISGGGAGCRARTSSSRSSRRRYRCPRRCRDLQLTTGAAHRSRAYSLGTDFNPDGFKGIGPASPQVHQDLRVAREGRAPKGGAGQDRLSGDQEDVPLTTRRPRE